MKTPKDKDPKKTTPRKKAARKKSATTKKVLTLDAARKKLEAAKKYKATGESSLMDAETPEAVQKALNTVKAGKNRIRIAKSDIRECKKAEKSDKTDKVDSEGYSTTTKVIIGVGVTAVAVATALGVSAIIDSGNGEEAIDAM